ncbi:MAG: LacI family transcriptional regulator [Microbacteriaceae bacterium]|jgi:LacI family transcriptional regulator|nr:LacI family transcriptional regulator [Microbacteriaceae bacterium]
MPEASKTTSDRGPTIHTVAAAAGVAASTVSRALSNPGRVNAVTRKRIEDIAAELGYSRPARQQPPMSGPLKTVAVFVADITNPFYFDVIRGTQQQLKAAGYAQLLVDTEESGELEGDMVTRLRGSFDGAILAASRLSDKELGTLSQSIPLVVINRNVKGVPGIVIDTPTGVVQALEHLVSLGHRDIVYVAGPARSWANEMRWRALRQAAGKHGLEARRIGPFPPDRTAGSAAADAVLNSGATACVAYNDLVAIGMLRRFKERGIDVPGRISVVGCDDIFGADFCHPPLTTLTAPIEQVGRVAVSMLLGTLEQRPGARRTQVVLPTHLTVRESTGPVSGSTQSIDPL